MRKTNGEYEISLTPFMEEEVVAPVEDEIDNAIEPIIIGTEKDDDLNNDVNKEDIEEEIPEEKEIVDEAIESAPKKKRTNKKRK